MVFEIIFLRVVNGNFLKKHRLIDSRTNQHLVRFDEGEDTLLQEMNLDRVRNLKNIDAVVISDYNKGFLRYNTIVNICEIFNKLINSS